MAASVTKNYLIRDVPQATQESTISSLQPNVDVTITAKGPSGVSPVQVWHVLTTPPTDGSLVGMTWTASDSSADTYTVRFHSSGSLAGAVVKVWAQWNANASGGIS